MRQQKTKLKAAFLLLVFALNTVVGFACSVGLINYTQQHHKHDATHSHGEGHEHEKTLHHHDENVDLNNHDHLASDNNHTQSDQENNCCSDNAVKVTTSDKIITSVHQNLLPLQVELMATIYAFLLPDYYSTKLLVKPKPPFDRSWDLSDHTNIRITIQSFQI